MLYLQQQQQGGKMYTQDTLNQVRRLRKQLSDLEEIILKLSGSLIDIQEQIIDKQYENVLSYKN
jgi:hypothetical protein